MKVIKAIVYSFVAILLIPISVAACALMGVFLPAIVLYLRAIKQKALKELEEDEKKDLSKDSSDSTNNNHQLTDDELNGAKW